MRDIAVVQRRYALLLAHSRKAEEIRLSSAVCLARAVHKDARSTTGALRGSSHGVPVVRPREARRGWTGEAASLPAERSQTCVQRSPDHDPRPDGMTVPRRSAPAESSCASAPSRRQWCSITATRRALCHRRAVREAVAQSAGPPCGCGPLRRGVTPGGPRRRWRRVHFLRLIDSMRTGPHTRHMSTSRLVHEVPRNAGPVDALPARALLCRMCR